MVAAHRKKSSGFAAAETHNCSGDSRVTWNNGKLTGQKPPLKLQEMWAILTKLQISANTRELAMFVGLIASLCDLTQWLVHLHKTVMPKCDPRQINEAVIDMHPRGKIPSFGPLHRITRTAIYLTHPRPETSNAVIYRLESGTQQMNPLFCFGHESGVSFPVVWEDGDRVVGRGWLPGRDGVPKAVLAVWHAADHPRPTSLARLAHEYDLKDELDGSWAVRPLELVREHGRTVLLLDDPGGEPLAKLLGTPMEVGRFLRLAISITAALDQFHQRGLIHKDLKPVHILVNDAPIEARLTGFGIASRQSRERQALAPPEEIAGTLAYMAPEQTGRMNRSIDARSDLYSLGVTLYQMLTGVLPFATDDPMDLLHSHLARQPVPPRNGYRRSRPCFPPW